MNLLRLVLVVLALPGRLLIQTIDGLKRANGVPPLGKFLRGCVHTFIWFVGFVLLVSATTPPAPTPARSAASSAPSYAPMPSTEEVQGAVNEYFAETSSEDRVARVIDGDTFELADGRKVRVLGIDSCESDTPGGPLATAKARELLVGPIELRAEPGVDEDRFGRLLRYVQTSSGDFGEAMVGYDHTGIYQGDNDASEAYVTGLYAHDLDHAASPPSGRECGEYPPPVTRDDDAYVPVPDDDDDGESRFCNRRWWC